MSTEPTQPAKQAVPDAARAQAENVTSDRLTKGRQGEQLDPFVRDRLFPDANNVFAFRPASLADIKRDCIVVLDTNILLTPYRVGAESLKDIGHVYKALAAQNRLVVPAQVAKEFAMLRPKYIGELVQQWSRINSQLGNPQVGEGNYPLLERMPDYDQYRQAIGEYKAAMAKCKKHAGAVLAQIKTWNMDDPVSELYRACFTGDVVQDPPLDKAMVLERLRHNRLHQLPPGYKDAGKDDEGIGDLLIWLTILSLGQRKKSLLFVTGETKADWCYRSENATLGPRIELVLEYVRSSDGGTLHLVKLSEAIELFGGDRKTVEEVRQAQVIGASEEPRWITNREAYRLVNDAIRRYSPESKATLNKFGLHLTEQSGNTLEVIVVPMFDFSESLADVSKWTTAWQDERERQRGFILCYILDFPNGAKLTEYLKSVGPLPFEIWVMDIDPVSGLFSEARYWVRLFRKLPANTCQTIELRCRR